MRATTLCLGLFLLAGQAAADPLPNMVPSHDVTGTYLVNGVNGQQSFAVEYSAGLAAARITPQTGQGYILYNFGTHDAKMIMPQMQKYMDEAALAARVQALQTGGGSAAPGANSGRAPEVKTLGTKTVAGHQCVETEITDPSTGDWSRICVTGDGVTLEVTSSKGDQVIAQSISYAAVPEADVQVPAGYTEFVMPALPSGMSMPGLGSPAAQ